MHNLWADTPPFTRKEERESTALKKNTSRIQSLQLGRNKSAIENLPFERDR